MCVTKNVVYIGECNLCGKQYCGETEQFFGKRVDQHHTTDTAVSQHWSRNHADHPDVSFSWSIHDKTSSFVERKISEALVLKKKFKEPF